MIFPQNILWQYGDHKLLHRLNTVQHSFNIVESFDSYKYSQASASDPVMTGAQLATYTFSEVFLREVMSAVNFQGCS